MKKVLISFLLLSSCVTKPKFNIGDCVTLANEPREEGSECKIVAYERGKGLQCNLPVMFNILGQTGQFGVQSIILPQSWIDKNPLIKVDCSPKFSYDFEEEE
jgi:hypothetical protein